MATPATPSYQIAPPSPMDFSKPEEWQKWIRRFERFRQASGLSIKLIEHSDYGALKDEMIRDKIVVGLVDEQLSEKLQLTLKRAVDQARQKEAVRKQQAVVRCNPPGVTTNVDAMRSKPKSSRHATTKHQKRMFPKNVK